MMKSLLRKRPFIFPMVNVPIPFGKGEKADSFILTFRDACRQGLSYCTTIEDRKSNETVVLAILTRVCGLFAVPALTSPFGIFFLPLGRQRGIAAGP
jgi:hypothetical protein